MIIQVDIWRCLPCECWVAVSIKGVKIEHKNCPRCVHSMDYVGEGELNVNKS